MFSLLDSLLPNKNAGKQEKDILYSPVFLASLFLIIWIKQKKQDKLSYLALGLLMFLESELGKDPLSLSKLVSLPAGRQGGSFVDSIFNYQGHIGCGNIQLNGQ